MGTVKDQLVQSFSAHRLRGRRGWRWAIWITLVSVLVLLVVGEVIIRRAGPILKGRVIETLSRRFDSQVELDDLQVSILRGLQVSGKGLRIFPPDDVVAAGAKNPLIAVQDFNFHAGLIGLFLKPMHVGVVHVQGLAISIPPRPMREQGAKKSRHQGKIKIVVDEIVCNDSRLVIDNGKAG